MVSTVSSYNKFICSFFPAVYQASFSSAESNSQMSFTVVAVANSFSWGFWLAPSDSDPCTLGLFLWMLQKYLKAANLLPVVSGMWCPGMCSPIRTNLRICRLKKKKLKTLSFGIWIYRSRNAWNWSLEQKHSSEICWQNWISLKDLILRPLSVVAITTDFAMLRCVVEPCCLFSELFVWSCRLTSFFIFYV